MKGTKFEPTLATSPSSLRFMNSAYRSCQTLLLEEAVELLASEWLAVAGHSNTDPPPPELPLAEAASWAHFWAGCDIHLA